LSGLKGLKQVLSIMFSSKYTTITKKRNDSIRSFRFYIRHKKMAALHL
jgi:hypothetical protein